MSGSDETKELGGLARSIDALFKRGSGTGSGAPTESAEAAELPGATVAEDPGERAVHGPSRAGEPPTPTHDLPSGDEDPLAYEGPPDYELPSALAEATPERFPGGYEVPSDAYADTGPVESAVEEAGGLGPQSVDPLGVTEPLDTPSVGPDAPPGAGPGLTDSRAAAPGPAADALAAVVEEFLAGSAAAADRVAEVAAPLLDQFALDPLADAAEKLVHAAGDPPDESVMAVAHAVMNPAVASKLVHRMGAEPEPRRAEYIVLARRLGRIMAIAIRGALTDATDRSARRAYYDALIAMGRTSRPIIEGMVDDENRFLVRNAVAILGEIGGDGAVALVTSALANTDARVRKEALRSLAKLGAEDADQLVVAHLEDSDPTVRVAAALAAGDLKVERALRPILAMLEAEEEPAERIPLLRALGLLGDPGAVPAIEKHAAGSLFSRPPSDVRIAAYRALHHIGTPHARQLLKQAGSDKDVVVQAAVRELLRADSASHEAQHSA